MSKIRKAVWAFVTAGAGAAIAAWTQAGPVVTDDEWAQVIVSGLIAGVGAGIVVWRVPNKPTEIKPEVPYGR